MSTKGVSEFEPLSSAPGESDSETVVTDVTMTTDKTASTFTGKCAHSWSIKRYIMPNNKCMNAIRPVGLGVGKLKLKNVHMERGRDSNDYNITCKTGGSTCCGHVIMHPNLTNDEDEPELVAMPSIFARSDEDFEGSDVVAYNKSIATGSMPDIEAPKLFWNKIKGTSGTLYSDVMSVMPTNSARFVAGSKYSTEEVAAVWIPPNAWEKGRALFMGSKYPRRKDDSCTWTESYEDLPTIRPYKDYKFVLVGRHPMASHTNYMPARLFSSEPVYATTSKDTYNVAASCVSVTMTLAKSIHLDLDGDSVTIKFPYSKEEEKRVELMLKNCIENKSLHNSWDEIKGEVLALDTNMTLDRTNYTVVGTVTPKFVKQFKDSGKDLDSIYDMCAAKPEVWDAVANRYENLHDRSYWLKESSKKAAAIGSGRRDVGKTHNMLKSAIWIGSLHSVNDMDMIKLPASNKSPELPKIAFSYKIKDPGLYWLVATYKVFGKFGQLAIDSAKRDVVDKAKNYFGRIFSDMGTFFAVFKDETNYKHIDWYEDKMTDKIKLKNTAEVVATNVIEFVPKDKAWDVCLDSCEYINKCEHMKLTKDEVFFLACMMYSVVNAYKSSDKFEVLSSMKYTQGYKAYTKNALINSILGGYKGVREYWSKRSSPVTIKNVAAAVMLGNFGYLPAVLQKD